MLSAVSCVPRYMGAHCAVCDELVDHLIMGSTAVHISIIRPKPSAIHRILQAYAAWGYNGRTTSVDTIFIAEREGELVGLVRMVPEEGTIVLRGMYVHPSHRRSGIGLQLLNAATRWLAARDCYCVSYAHLEAFYRRGGFQQCDVIKTPPFLKKRLKDYRRQGLDVQLIYRPRDCWQYPSLLDSQG